MAKTQRCTVTYKKRFYTGAAIVFLGLLMNYLETWYFGWNRRPSCHAEFMWDAICLIVMLVGFYWCTSAKIVINIHPPVEFFNESVSADGITGVIKNSKVGGITNVR